jgi:threonine/homoserine/homoserine lactone efflux protein
MVAIIANPQLLELLIGLATNGITSILSAFHKTGAAAAVNAADQVAMAVLQQTATIKGLTIDWSNPTAVQQYIASLPAFVPIPEPAPTSAPAAPAPTAPKA